MDSQKVWASDPVHGYVLGQIIDIGPDGVTVQPFGNQAKVNLIFSTFQTLVFSFYLLI